ncbi:LPS export ABC transporter permease LptG [Acidomonas methanolica]|uniref:LPS export ABC transporter permease LptG n=1 Tax=Acidomonas methanolica TaxID=437 RepID=UPI00211A5123|nr:LPS export ABC transporter permease LptG [Acidomonas methanolica]MCQ9156286.1 LPS export ABC transporter permease LptG [Acidomonas methanolica]
MAQRIDSLRDALRPDLATFYIQKTTLRGFGTVAAALTALFTLLDFVGELAHVGKGHYGVRDALAYVLLLSPQRLIEVSPIAMMFGCLLALGAMARHEELTAFFATGLSEFRILRAVILLVPAVSALLLVLSQFVVPSAEFRAQQLHAAATEEADVEDGVWTVENGVFLHVGVLADGRRPEDIDIYRFGGTDALQRYIHAAHASVRPDGDWLLEDVTVKDIHDGLFRTSHPASLRWRPIASLRELRLLGRPRATVSATALLSYIREREAQGHPDPLYVSEFWSRAALPFSMIGLVMFAAPLLFGPARARGIGARMGGGVLIAITYSLFQQIALRLGLLAGIPSVVTSLAPPLALILLGVYLIILTRQP